MPQIHAETVVGVFEHPDEALHAVHQLQEAGFTEKELELLRREQVPGIAKSEEVAVQKSAGRGALQGAIGGALGGFVGAVIGAITVEHLGLSMAVVSGAALAAALGTFCGAFLSMGMTERRPHPTPAERGKTVVLVHTAQKKEDARRLLRQEGAYDDRTHSPS